MKRPTRGFTLIELLVVIGIVVILATVVFVVIGPVELQKERRDTQRLNDLALINSAITARLQETGVTPAQILCAGASAPCSGNSDEDSTNVQKIDGTGWVKVDMRSSTVKPPALPLDQVNDASFHYSYSTNSSGDKYELNTTFESKKYTITQPLMNDDMGNDPQKYELGTDLNII